MIGFNPYFTGSISKTSGSNGIWKSKKQVSILILLDQFLKLSLEKLREIRNASFNPYFTGSISKT